jgi:hypothetical protein
MAANDLSAALPAHAHPMANPGYGKRNAPDQAPARADDFAHLPAREASVAAFTDGLPEGADISVKTLAKELPDYGQCALRTALRRIAEAGHLRRVSEHLPGSGSARWVTRTYFSRTARPDAWWGDFCGGRLPREEPASATRPKRSRAYDVLAALGRTDPRMTLSAADCAVLEQTAAQWLERGATEEQLTVALTAALPPEVASPRGFARRRLADRMPPETAHEPPARRPLRMLECVECRAPGTAAALPGGRCSACRNEAPPPPDPNLPTTEGVHGHAARMREGVIAARVGVERQPSTGRPGRRSRQSRRLISPRAR